MARRLPVVASCIAVLALAAPVAAPAKELPYTITGSHVVWDTHLVKTVGAQNEIRPGLRIMQPGGSVTGIMDDHLPLLTKPASVAIRSTAVRHARTVIEIELSPQDKQVKAWMRKVRQLGYSTMIAVRIVPSGKRKKVPSTGAYLRWLRSMLRAYPQISAIEATNEPELTKIPVKQAVEYYNAARHEFPTRQVLAGGFSDVPTTQAYVRQYSSLMDRPAEALWAFHVYNDIMDATPRPHDRFTWTLRATGAKRIMVTETGAFVEYGTAGSVRKFTHAELVKQTRRVQRLSQRPGVQRTYWTGFQACHGCVEAE